MKCQVVLVVAVALLAVACETNSVSLEPRRLALEQFEQLRLVATSSQPHTADAYEGPVEFVRTEHELVVLKPGVDNAAAITQTYVLTAEDPNSFAGLPERLTRAQTFRAVDGNLVIQDRNSAAAYVFALEGAEDLSRLLSPEANVVSFALTTSGITNTLPQGRGAYEGRATVYRSTALRLGLVSRTDDDGSRGGGGGGWSFVGCECRGVFASYDDCDAGGTGSSGCSITRSDGTGCSISGCNSGSCCS